MTEDRASLVREFFSHAPRPRELSFLYLGYAGIIVWVDAGAVAFDIANLLRGDELVAVKKLDLLFYTHNHSDHYHRAPARKLVKETDVHIVAQPQVAEDLSGSASSDRLTVGEPGTAISVGGFEVKIVAGVHPRPISLCRIKAGEVSIFHGGDSGYVPVKECAAQVAFLPTGRPSPSCSPESALRFARDLRPRIVVALHGNKAELTRFKRLMAKEMPDTTVLIPEKFHYQTLFVPTK